MLHFAKFAGPAIVLAGILSPVSVYALAKWADTIPYEIFCRIGKRVPRVAVAPEGWGHADARPMSAAGH